MANRARTTIVLLSAAAAVGAVVGIASTGSIETVATPGDLARRVAVRAGVARLRPPRPGDNWGGCHDARAAGTTPIYRGEPGYRENMDGDGDGVACEPPRG